MSTDITAAVVALRTSREALPEYARTDAIIRTAPAVWAYDDAGNVVTAAGRYPLVAGFVAEAGSNHVAAHIALAASPRVTEALEQLLAQIAWHGTRRAHSPDDCDGTCIDDLHRHATALAAAINRSTAPEGDRDGVGSVGPGGVSAVRGGHNPT